MLQAIKRRRCDLHFRCLPLLELQLIIASILLGEIEVALLLLVEVYGALGLKELEQREVPSVGVGQGYRLLIREPKGADRYLLWRPLIGAIEVEGERR